MVGDSPPLYFQGVHKCIIKIGLNYFHAHRFRSRAVIEFGNPITISPELVKNFKEGGNLKREACSSLLDSIYNALKTVTINADSYETLMVHKIKTLKKICILISFF